MGIRQTLNKYPGIVALAAAVVIGVSLILIFSAMRPAESWDRSQLFYSIDDGKTWFADDAAKVAPFEKDGAKAYEVWVWTCNDRRTEFVSHLVRYDEEARRKLQAQYEKEITSETIDLIKAYGSEVKSPGNGDAPGNWIRRMDPRATRIVQATCPDGEDIRNLRPVLP